MDFGDPVVVLLLDLGGLVLKPGGFGDTVEDRLPRRAVGGPVDLSLQSRHALVATLDLEHGDRPKTEGEHRVDAGLVQHDDPLRLLLDGR